MFKNLKIFAIGIFVVTAILPSLVKAASYYVSPSGSDTNTGTTQSAPWKTLSKLNATTFSAGDTIYFATNGTWVGNLSVRGTGTSNAPITFTSYGTGTKPIISNAGVQWAHGIDISTNYIVVDGLLFQNLHEAGVYIHSTGNYDTIKNSEFTAVGAGVILDGSNNLITGNNMHDLTMTVNDTAPYNDYGANGVITSGNNNEISYNSCITCRAPSIDYPPYDGGFVEIYNGSSNTYIHHNYIKDTEGVLEVGGSSNPTITGVRMAYNLAVNSIGLCIHVADSQFAVTPSGWLIDNNTFISDGTGSFINCDMATSSGITMRNNIVYNYAKIVGGSNASNNFSHNNNLFYNNGLTNLNLGAGDINANPLFVNSTNDFHLQSTSPAIDRGDASTGYSFSGTAPDMGAYEYIASTTPDTQAPTIPTGIAISVASSSQINLSWSASTDNVAVSGYYIYRGGVKLANVTNNSYQDTGLSANTNYSYTISSYDSAGNISSQSATVSATTSNSSSVVASAPPIIPATGTGYIWRNNVSSLSNKNRISAPGLVDGNITTNVQLNAGITDSRNTYEAGGEIFNSSKTISSASFVSGSWNTTTKDGSFTANMTLQYTTDGTTWNETGWRVSPSYTYDGVNNGGITYTFTGSALTVKGIRVSGKIHTSGSYSWYANIREING